EQQALAAAGDHAGLFRADEGFHAIVLSLTGFPGARAAAEAVSAPLRRARMLLFPEPGRAEETVREHAAVLKALRARDPAAARAAMKAHLGQLIRRIEPLERAHPHLFRDPAEGETR
ncbi:MAG: FCD domain-containing protein, partial [Rubrimonas sp.]